MDLMKIAEQAFATAREVELPSFRSGDTITVYYKIKEDKKERLQLYRGVVMQIKGTGDKKMFTVRKISNGIGVERIFPMNSPFIEKVEVNKFGKVRRARIYYFRKLTGKRANIRERVIAKTND